MVIVGMLGHFLIPNHEDQKCPRILTVTIFFWGTGGAERGFLECRRRIEEGRRTLTSKPRLVFEGECQTWTFELEAGAAEQSGLFVFCLLLR